MHFAVSSLAQNHISIPYHLGNNSTISFLTDALVLYIRILLRHAKSQTQARRRTMQKIAYSVGREPVCVSQRPHHLLAVLQAKSMRSFYYGLILKMERRSSLSFALGQVAHGFWRELWQNGFVTFWFTVTRCVPISNRLKASG